MLRQVYIYIYRYDFIKQPYPLCDRTTDTNFCLRVFSFHFYPHNGRGTEGERKGNGSSSLMLVLSSPQVRRSTRQGRLVTVACHCISRPLPWARSWQRGMGGREGGAEAQMPPDVPTQWPKAAGSHRPRQNGRGTEGIWLVTTIWRPRAVWMPGQNCNPLYPSLCVWTLPTLHCVFVGPDLLAS